METGPGRRVRDRTRSLKLARARGRGRRNLPRTLNPRNSNPSSPDTMPDLVSDTSSPMSARIGPHQAIGGLDLPASISQDHEVIGVTDQPEPGCSHLDVEPVEVDVGEQRRDDSPLGSARGEGTNPSSVSTPALSHRRMSPITSGSSTSLATSRSSRRVVQMIEEPDDVELGHPAVAPADRLAHPPHRLPGHCVRADSRSCTAGTQPRTAVRSPGEWPVGPPDRRRWVCRAGGCVRRAWGSRPAAPAGGRSAPPRAADDATTRAGARRRRRRRDRLPVESRLPRHSPGHVVQARARLAGSAMASNSWPIGPALLLLSAPSLAPCHRAAASPSSARRSGAGPCVLRRGARFGAWSWSAPSPDTGPPLGDRAARPRAGSGSAGITPPSELLRAV